MNILISAKGRALLTDFGLSCMTHSSFSVFVEPPCGGSWHWVAPENIESLEFSVTRPGDVWAFGMTALVCQNVLYIQSVLNTCLLGVIFPRNPFL